MWEEKEEGECSYTKATPGCGGGRAEDEGRMDSSTEQSLIRHSLYVLPVPGERAESGVLWKRLSFKNTIALNNPETASVSSGVWVVGAPAKNWVAFESSTPSRSKEASPEPDGSVAAKLNHHRFHTKRSAVPCSLSFSLLEKMASVRYPSFLLCSLGLLTASLTDVQLCPCQAWKRF